jgi:uncharacterized protein (DUF427 family)/uncharacterized membrane protein
MNSFDPRRMAEALEEQDSLDRLADPIAAFASRALAGRAKDVLGGAWLGHPLHPLLTDLPIGAWTSAIVLDLLGGRRARPAADALVGVGIVTALPTALSGVSDWSDLEPRQRRVGLVHAAANDLALGLYLASFVARRRGRRVRGTLLGLMGAAAMSAGGYLGGHLVYELGAGVDRSAFQDAPDEESAMVDLSAPPPSGHRITTEKVDGSVRAVLHGEVIAESADALLLREAGLQPVVYFPREDVRMELLSRTEHRTHCPFKGDASYWSVQVGDRRADDLAWAYEEPLPGRSELLGRIAFYADRLDKIEVDRVGTPG